MGTTDSSTVPEKKIGLKLLEHDVPKLWMRIELGDLLLLQIKGLHFSYIALHSIYTTTDTPRRGNTPTFADEPPIHRPLVQKNPTQLETAMNIGLRIVNQKRRP